MDTIITFLIGKVLVVSVATAVLFGTYWLLFRKGNRFNLMRAFLIGSLVFAFALPFIKVNFSIHTQSGFAITENLVNYFTLNEVTIQPKGEAGPIMLDEVTVSPQQKHINVWQILFWAYWAGVAVFALMLIVKLLRIVLLAAKSPKVRDGRYVIVRTKREHISFSFFNYIFLPQGEDNAAILIHEKSHSDHHHTADVLFVEALTVVQWFNPAMRWYKRELQNLHEYTADRDVLESGAARNDYMMLILQQCTAGNFSTLGNNFSFNLTKKRIKMMTQECKMKGLLWRVLGVLPVAAVLLVANAKVTAQEKTEVPPTKEEKIKGFLDNYEFKLFIGSDDGSGAPIEYSDHVLTIDPERIELDGLEVGDTVSIAGCQFTQTEKLDSITGKMVKGLQIINPKSSAIHFTDLGNNKFQVTMRNTDSIYEVVEDMPEFPGGMSALVDFMSKNVKYPKSAIDNNIEGKTFVEFVVEKDGSVSNVRTKKGFDKDCDAEAERVVKAMPKWTPGKVGGEAVRVSFVLPVAFQLNAKQNEMQLVYSQVEGGWKQNPYGNQKEIHSFNDFKTFVIDEMNYTSQALEKKIQGNVTFEFDVKNGMVANAKIIKGLGYGIDDELLRVLKLSAEFDKAMEKHYGNNTIKFSLREDGGNVVRSINWDGFKKSTAEFDDENKATDDETFQIVEKMPEFPGGEKALLNFISENIIYPESAKDKNISGRVFVTFVVEKDGSVSDVKLLRGIGKECDEEAMRVVKAMPKWKPGMNEGKPVRVSYALPIHFRLDDNGKRSEYDVVEKVENKIVVDHDADPIPSQRSKTDEETFQIVDQMPEFPGGEKALLNFIAENIVYPQSAKDKNISGRVFLSFVIDKDGSVTDVKVMRGIDKECDAEAMRVVKAMPKWKPGMNEGKPVRVSYMLPISFQLKDDAGKGK